MRIWKCNNGIKMHCRLFNCTQDLDLDYDQDWKTSYIGHRIVEAELPQRYLGYP